MRGLTSLLLAVVACFTPRMLAAGPFEDDQRLDGGPESPHLDWGRGWTRGRVRALFFIGRPRGEGESSISTASRDVIEVLRRFDIDAEAVFMHADGVFRSDPKAFPKQQGLSRLAGLLERPWDVYVFCGARYDKLPEDARRRIEGRIEEGAGVVSFGDPRPAPLSRARPIETPPWLGIGLPWATRTAPPAPERGGKKGKSPPPPETERTVPAADLQVFAIGKARGVAVHHVGGTLSVTPVRPWSRESAAEYEIWSAVAGQCVLWAAGRDPEVNVSILGGAPLRVERAPPGVARVEAILATSRPTRHSVTVRPVLIDAGGVRRPLPAAVVEVAPGTPVRIGIPLPALPEGLHGLALLLDADGRSGFGARDLRVETPEGIASLALDLESAREGQTVTGRVVLRGLLTKTVGDRLIVRMRDPEDRIVARRDVPIPDADSPARFSLEVPEPAATLLSVEAALLDDAGEVSVASRTLTVPHPGRDRFQFVLWGGYDDVPGAIGLRRARDAGVTAMLGTGPPGAAATALGLAHIPYCTHINGDPGSGVCWNDAPKIDDFLRGLLDGTGSRAWAKPAQSRGVGALAYSLGDEIATSGFCDSPACLRGFRDYLHESYGDIAALNASWQTGFASFDDVQPMPGEESLRKRLYPRRIDREAFARVNFAGLCRRFSDAVGRFDPGAPAGFEGAASFGDDIDGIVRANGFWVPYPGRGVDDLIRSLAPRTFLRSNWTGYERDARALKASVWRSLAMGASGVWWFDTDSWLAPTMELRPAAAEVAAALRPFREGLGDILVRSEMPFDGVAVLYSLPSALSCEIADSSATLGEPSEMNNSGRPHWAVADVTKDLGYQFRYVTSRILEQEGLDSGRCRVLWLPLAQALSAREADAVRRFVQGGGWVIADLRPGIYDPHCRPLDKGLLDDVFGARREGSGPGREASLSLRFTFEGREHVLTNAHTQIDPHLRATDAQVLAREGDIPLLLLRRQGRGGALLLNFEISEYSEKRHEPSADGIRELFGAVYAAGGLRPRVTLEGVRNPVRGVETACWRNGDALIFSLFRNPGLWHSLGPVGLGPKEPLEVKAALPAPAHVYDLRARTYLGLVPEARVTLGAADAQFLVALPRKIGPVSLVLAPAGVRTGERAEARLRVESPSGGHAFLVEGFTPSGDPAPWLRQVVLATNGEARVPIPVAFNDPTGTWRLRATEAYSGQAAEAELTVTAAP